MVATAPQEPAERIVGFGSAILRERLWYLSMLFVLPGFQSGGLGRTLLSRLLPSDEGVVRATATDSAQPIANALYASIGMAPRMPLFNLTGLPDRPAAFGSLPSGVVPIAFKTIAGGAPDGAGHQELAAAIDAIDREALGGGASDGPSLPADGATIRLALPRTRTGRLSAMGMPARRVAWVRWRFETKRWWRRCSGISRPPSCRAAPSRHGSGGRRIVRSQPPSALASGLIASRSCCAGIGRSRTSVGICRSLQGSCESLGVSPTGGSLRLDVASPAAPAHEHER